MPLSEIKIDIAELRSLDIDNLLSSCEKQLCYEFERHLRNQDSSPALRLLLAACSMRLSSENAKVPFAPLIVTEERRGIIASDFSKEALESLKEFSKEVKNNELKARLCDLVWITKSGSVDHAYEAIDAYLSSAKELLENEDSWYYAFERIERALRLSCFHKREKQRPDLFQKISDFIIDKVNNKSDDFYLALRLLELSLECGVGELDWIYKECEEIANERFQSNDFRIAIDAWKAAQSASTGLRDREKTINTWRKISECHVKDSENQSPLIAAGCVMHAIEALAKVPKTRQERLELYELMRDHQIESLHEMSQVSTPAQDISKSVYASIERSKGRDFFDSLFRLGNLRASDVKETQ